MRNNKVYAILALCVSISILLEACGGGGDPTPGGSAGENSNGGSGEKVKITFWDENAGPTRTPYYDELIKRFQEKNPNIQVEYVGLPAASAKQKYDVAIASGDTPDVGDVYSYWASDFITKGTLLPLDDYFNKWSEKDKIAKTQISYNRDLAPDKKLYQIPNTTNIDLLWYRSDWTQAAGLKPMQTWDDFFNTVEKLTDKSKNQYGFSIRGGAGSTSLLISLMYAYSTIDTFFDSNGKSTMNDPKHVEFLKKYAALYKNYTTAGDITNGYKEMVAEFDSGSAAIIAHNLGSYNDHLKALGEGKFSAMPFPTNSGKHVISGGNNGYSIFKNSKHPDAAWQFISFLNSAESQAYWNQNIGQLPTNSDAAKTDFFQNAPHLKIASAVINDPNTIIMNQPQYLPDWANIYQTQMEPLFQKVLSGTMSAEDFLNTWANALTKSKAEYDKNVKK